jgi:3-methyl-2-oxobutanoate hydroxymethyltransferase
MSVNKEIRRVTTHVLSEMKLKGEKIAMLTSYDFSMAKLVDEAGIDIILVGDSASNVMAGNETSSDPRVGSGRYAFRKLSGKPAGGAEFGH